MVYKVSYVVVGARHPGEIRNEERPPEVGEEVSIGLDRFLVLEVIDLVPSRGDFAYLHVTCKRTTD